MRLTSVMGLLGVMASRVRLGTTPQLLAIWDFYDPGVEHTRGDLNRLAAGGFLRRDTVVCRLPVPRDEPAVRWDLGDPVPDFGRIAWQQEKHWAVEPVSATVWRAGRGTFHAFGNSTGRGGVNYAAISHDLAVTALLVTFMRLHPERVAHWRGEDVRRGGLPRGVKVPDVVLQADDGTPYLVCEVLGVYPPARLLAFHAHCADVLRQPYEAF